MSVTPVNSSSSQAAVANTVNNLAKELESTKSVQVFKDDTGTRRVLLGRGEGGFNGLKVSQPGFDVTTAANNELVFNSDFNVPKIVTSGVATLDAIAGTSVVYALDISGLELTEAPMLLVMAKRPGSPNTYYSMPYSVNITAPTLLVEARTWVNFSSGGSEEVRFQVELGASASAAVGTWSFRYYIFVESSES